MSPQKNTTKGLAGASMNQGCGRLQTWSDQPKFPNQRQTGSLILRPDDPNENDDDLIAYQKDIKILENEHSNADKMLKALS